MIRSQPPDGRLLVRLRLDLTVTPKYPVSVSVLVSKYRHQKRLVSVSVFLTPEIAVSVSVSKYRHRTRLVSVSVFLTPKIVASVSEGLGFGFSHTDTKTAFFCVLKEKNANKVGFRIKKYLRHLKTLVSVSVSDFSDTKKNGVGVGKTDTKKCWRRVSNSKLTSTPTSTPTPVSVSMVRLSQIGGRRDKWARNSREGKFPLS